MADGVALKFTQLTRKDHSVLVEPLKGYQDLHFLLTESPMKRTSKTPPPQNLRFRTTQQSAPRSVESPSHYGQMSQSRAH